MPEPRPKVSQSTRGVGNPHAIGHGAILRHGAHVKSEARARQEQPHQENHEGSEKNDDDAIVRQHHVAAEIETARHPRRIGDLDVLGAEQHAHKLNQDQADAPGRQ